MERCPYCGSEDIYFSKKRKLFVCEDCDKTFTEQQMSEVVRPESSDHGLELFFSYGHDKNRLLVERIRRDLEKRGHHVWIDTSEIKAGDHWRDDILNGVLNASSIIAFLSEHSTRNPGVCLDELKIAVCVKGANIKTVLLEPENRIRTPATLSDIQWLDMSDWYERKNSSEADFESWYRGKFAELCQAIESADTVELNGDIHVLKTKLSPYLNSEKEYTLLSREFYGRRWLEERIEDWQDRKSTKTLILYGKPGSGKSAFSVNYSHYNSDVYGCFLCEWNREYTINPARLIRTMAFRLATKLPDYRSLLLRQLESDICLEEMSAEALFDFLLTWPLNHLVDGNRETGMIVVDGLDEAESKGENPLAEMFAKCVERLPGWIRFVFTSRREKSVARYFQASEEIDIIEDMPEGYNDIMAYLVKTLAEELRQTSNKLEVLNKICRLSDGIFLYAEMLVADIKNGFIRLSEIDSFPRGLNAFYQVSMQRKFPTPESFRPVRGVMELLAISETIPEELVRRVCELSQYAFLICLDKLGSWVNRYEEKGMYLLGFSHKSLRDWLTNPEQSGAFYVDYRSGALRLARYCREYLDRKPAAADETEVSAAIRPYMESHLGNYYIVSGHFGELETFLLAHSGQPEPYWRIWEQFPREWDHTVLLEAFWAGSQRNAFVRMLQREGNVEFLLWIFRLAEQQYGIREFDRSLLSAYMDIVHMSGDYVRAVEIADQYLAGRPANRKMAGSEEEAANRKMTGSEEEAANRQMTGSQEKSANLQATGNEEGAANLQATGNEEGAANLQMTGNSEKPANRCLTEPEVEKENQKRAEQTEGDEDDSFLAMLRVRRLHHQMFYRPVGRLLDDAMALYSRMDDRFPAVYNELLFLIGGNLGVLHGDWEFCKVWLDRSEEFAKKHALEDYRMRNARKLADYWCHKGEYKKAEELIKGRIPADGSITGRYEAYLVGALANVYTCIGHDDEAMQCYEQLLKYTEAKGIAGWTAHANLGIANINFKIGNLKEAVDFATRANGIYRRIRQEWGIIMSEALLAACESRMGIAPMRVACAPAEQQAERMQYGSCVASIEELCGGAIHYLRLYFL